MGITENSNRATADAAQYIYAQNVLMPRLERREEAINTQILPFYGEGLVWRFDDIVPHSQEFDKGVALDGWNAGLLTKDEARELLGQEPCKMGGNVYKTTLSDIFLHDTEDPAEISSDLLADSRAEGRAPGNPPTPSRSWATATLTVRKRLGGRRCSVSWMQRRRSSGASSRLPPCATSAAGKANLRIPAWY